VVANEIFFTEGEKDADRIQSLKLDKRDDGIFAAATCNFGGASGEWRDEYALYFVGKKVVIFEDNDGSGRKHAERVAGALYPYAYGVKIVRFPELPEKGDVSDFLDSHSVDDLIARIRSTPQWRPGPTDDRVFVPARQFVDTTPKDVAWLVEGVIERGANGFICAQPKAGKSWAASADLALSLAAGKPWLEFSVPRPVRVALISREDNPSLTGWRLRHLDAGKGTLDKGNLYINSRAQTQEFFLDNPEQWQELVDALQRREIEFAMFDVFNVMHGAEENDNSEMRAVLRRLSQIQTTLKCGIGVVHHYSKSEQGSMTQRLRGASAIAGWAEWLIGISMADEETKVRRMDFELKAACPPDPIYFQIVSDTTSARLERTLRPEMRSTQATAARRYM
jgi:AAA domain